MKKVTRRITKSGTITIGGKTCFFRSGWEANIAAYLEFLKSKGEIYDWEFEVDTFWFDKIKRGVRSYKPDFKVWTSKTGFYYEEVKGYLDAKSKTKLNRMRIYHPKIEIRLLDKSRYDAIKRMSGIIPDWGML